MLTDWDGLSGSPDDAIFEVYRSRNTAGRSNNAFRFFFVMSAIAQGVKELVKKAIADNRVMVSNASVSTSTEELTLHSAGL